MKKVRIPLFVLAISLASCSAKMMLGTQYNYHVSVTGGKPDSKMDFEDSIVNAHFYILPSGIGLRMENKTLEPIKINWNEASLILNGESEKVMHSGIKYIDRNEYQPPTVIPPYSKITDNVIPTGNVYYKSGSYSKYYSSPGGWETKSVFEIYDMNKESNKTKILNHKGSKFRLFLPVEYKGQVKSYTFEFTVDDITTSEANWKTFQKS